MKRESDAGLEFAPPRYGVPSVQHHSTTGAPSSHLIPRPVRVGHDNDVWTWVLELVEYGNSRTSLEGPDDSLNEHVIPFEWVAHLSGRDP